MVSKNAFVKLGMEPEITKGIEPKVARHIHARETVRIPSRIESSEGWDFKKTDGSPRSASPAI